MINAKDRVIRGALIGAGNVTQFHMMAWERIPEAKIVAIVDPNLAASQGRAAEFGLPVQRTYQSFEALLDLGHALDFVDIAAPPETHLELVHLAAQNGLHVLCQKPFAPSLAEARQMIAVCREAGVLLNVNENWRWRSWYRKLRDLVKDGVVGSPVYARIFSHGSSWLPGNTKPGHRFLSWPRVILFDWGVHHVDIYRFLFGEPLSVFARIHRLNPNLVGEDRVVAVLNYPQMIAMIDLSWSSYAPRGNLSREHLQMVEDLRIEGDRGTIEFVRDAEEGDRIRLTTAAGVTEEPVWTDEPFEAYLGSYIGAQSHFIACLRMDKIPETVGQDNIKTLAVTLAAYESAETNQVVEMADFMHRDTFRSVKSPTDL